MERTCRVQKCFVNFKHSSSILSITLCRVKELAIKFTYIVTEFINLIQWFISVFANTHTLEMTYLFNVVIVKNKTLYTCVLCVEHRGVQLYTPSDLYMGTPLLYFRIHVLPIFMDP